MSLLTPFLVAFPSDAELELLEAERLRTAALLAKPPSNTDPLSAACDSILNQREAAKLAVQEAAFFAPHVNSARNSSVNLLRRPALDSQHRESHCNRRRHSGVSHSSSAPLRTLSPAPCVAPSTTLVQSPHSVVRQRTHRRHNLRLLPSLSSPFRFTASASDDTTFANMYLNSVKSLCLVNSKRNEMKLITRNRIIDFVGRFKYVPTRFFDPKGLIVRSSSHKQLFLSLHKKRGSKKFSGGSSPDPPRVHTASPVTTPKPLKRVSALKSHKSHFKRQTAAWHDAATSTERTTLFKSKSSSKVSSVKETLLQDLSGVAAFPFLQNSRSRKFPEGTTLLSKVTDYLMTFYAGHHSFYDHFRSGEDSIRLSAVGDFARLYCTIGGARKIFSLHAPRYAKFLTAFNETGDFSSFTLKQKPAEGFCYIEHLFDVNLHTGRAFPFKSAFSLGAYPKMSQIVDFLSEKISDDLCRSATRGSFNGRVFHCHRGGDYFYLAPDVRVGGSSETSPFNSTTTYFANNISYNLSGEDFPKLPRPRQKRCFRCKSVDFEDSTSLLRYVRKYLQNYVVGGGVFYDKFRNVCGTTVTIYVREQKAVAYLQLNNGVSCATSYEASEYVIHFGEVVLKVTNLKNYARAPKTQYGHCYLHYIFECCVGWGIQFDASKAIKALHTLPTLKCLQLYIKSLGLQEPKFLRGYFKSKTLFHCDIDSPTIVSVNAFKGCEVIGGITETTPSLLQDQELLQAVSTAISRSGAGRDSLLVKSVETEAIRVNEAARNERNKRPEQVIPYQLSEEKQACLVNAFPEFNLKFTHSTHSNHSIAASCRLLENALHNKKAGREYVDIGGCPKYHMMAGHSGVHICRPVCDLKDAQRKVLREHSILTTESLPHRLYDKVAVAGCGVTACSKMMADCDVQTGCMVATQVYDLSLDDMAKAMKSRGAHVFFFSLITPGEFLTDRDAFRLNTLEVDVIISRGDDRVTYLFGHTTYSHSLSKLMRFMQTSHFSEGKDLFSLEMYEVRCGVNFYQLTRSERCPNYVGTHLLRFPFADPGVTKVKIPRFDRQSRCCLPGADFLYLDSDFVEKIYLFTVNACQNVNSKTFDYVWNHIKNSKARLVISGKIVRRDVHLDISELESFAAVMLAAGVRSRLTAECFSKKIALAVNEMSVLAMVKYAVTEKLRHMKFRFRSRFTDLIKRVCKDAFDIDFLEASDLITSIGTHAEYVLEVRLKGEGSIPEDEESTFISRQASRLVQNSLQRDVITEAADEVIDSRIAAAEAANGFANARNPGGKGKDMGGLKGSGVGTSVLEWLISGLSSLVITTPAAIRDCLRNIAKEMSALQLAPKLRKLVSIVLNTFIFDDTISISVELLGKCFSKMLSAWYCYLRGGQSYRTTLAKFTTSVIIDCALSVCQGEKPQTLLDSQMKSLMTDYISKALVFGTSPISSDGVLTLSGVLVTLFRKVVSRCLNEEKSCYAGYYNHNAIDSPLISYLRRECRRLGVNLSGYFKQLVKDTIHEMVPSVNVKERSKECCINIAKNIAEGASWVTSFVRTSVKLDTEDFSDAHDNFSDAASESGEKPGLGGGSKASSIISGGVLFLGLKCFALFRDFPDMVAHLRELSSNAKAFHRFDISGVIDSFLAVCSTWRSKKYANTILNIGASLYYIIKFVLRIAVWYSSNILVWLTNQMDSYCKALVDCGLLPKALREVLKGIRNVCRSMSYITRLVVGNSDASCGIITSKLTGAKSPIVLIKQSKVISLGLKACFLKTNPRVGTYVDIRPNERCDGGVYYEFHSDLSDDDVSDSDNIMAVTQSFESDHQEILNTLAVADPNTLHAKEFSRSIGLRGGVGCQSLISEVIHYLLARGGSFIKKCLLISIISELCGSSLAVVGIPSVAVLLKTASKVDAFLRLMRLFRNEDAIINTCDHLIIFNNKFGFRCIELPLLRVRDNAGKISNNFLVKHTVKLCSSIVDLSDNIVGGVFRIFHFVHNEYQQISRVAAPRGSMKNGGEPSLSEDFDFSDEEEFSTRPGLNGAGMGNSVISWFVKAVGKVAFSKVPLRVIMHLAKIWVFKRSLECAFHDSLFISFAGCLISWLSRDQIYTKLLILSEIPTKERAFDCIKSFFDRFGTGIAIPDQLVIVMMKSLDVVYGSGLADFIRVSAQKVLAKFNRVAGECNAEGVSFTAVPVSEATGGFDVIDLNEILNDIESQRSKITRSAHKSQIEVQKSSVDKGKEQHVESYSSDSDEEIDAVPTHEVAESSSNAPHQTEKADLVQTAERLLPEIVGNDAKVGRNDNAVVRRKQKVNDGSYQCAYLKSLNLSVGTPSPYTMATGKGCTLSNSVREFYYLQEVSLFEVYVKCMKYFQEANTLNFDRKLLTCNEDNKLVLYDGTSRKMQLKNRVLFKSWEKVYKEHGYSYCYCSDGLIPFTDANARGRKVILHDDIAFLPQNLFLRSFSGGSFHFKNSGAKVRLYEAPPGGGKTHTLIDIFIKSFRMVDTLILTANKNSQIEISDKVERMVKQCDLRDGGGCLSSAPFVSTIDAFLMHTPDRRCELLLVDECFMVHAGEVIAAIDLTRCKAVLLFGDSRQIHYIHRGELESCRFSDLNDYIDDSTRVFGNKSFRCPWDVCEWLSKQYNNKIAAVKHETVGASSCSIKLIECEEDVEVDGDFKYLTYTQEEKHRMQHYMDKRGFKTIVNTVHEVQGETYKSVSLTRLKFQEDAPFSSMNHIVVALSRHTNSLVYNVLSARCTDRTCVELERMKNICEEFRKNPYTNTSHTYSISGITSAADNFKSKPCSAPIEIINYWLDDVLPGCGFGDNGDPSDEMRSSPFECGVDDVVVTDAAPPESVSTQQRVYYVRSQAIPKRKPSLQENLYSYESRNYNFIDSDKFSDPTLFGFCMAENFFNRCCQFERIVELKNDVIALSDKGFQTWFEKRDASQLKGLYKDMETPYDIESEIRRFKLMVKADAKVKLDASSLVKHPPAQNIMFHRKVVNAVYSQCFDEFKNRLIYVLKDNIKLYTEMPLETFGDLVGSMLGFSCDYEVGEVDFSKFDKSQDKFIKAFERRIYESFGFDAELLDVWMEGEYEGRARTLDGQLSFTVENQRRSGASNTWVGNSLVTLGILSLYYDIEKFDALFVSGDDSLIFSKKPIKNFSETICLETGFETKFMNPSVPYFCSKFLVFTGNRVVFLPDPYKLLVKLGAPLQEVSIDYLMALFESFKDLTSGFDDQIVIDILTELVHFKHNFSSEYTNMAICSIHCLRANFKTFRRLYPEVRGWIVVPMVSKFLQRSLPEFVVRRYPGIKGLCIEFESDLNSDEPHPYRNPESVF
ncbi:polyprotein 1a/1b [Blackcurrant-associated closterovirus 1]|uniref:Polyprotein 1a/1b n=1 Tax=Blackcurrant closterovirus 1 TaxID=2734344 RepID=A0A385L375_9CLOS|nr:polyprotein 1a/1b [Blackcurrant-associated closterovirus 1]AYA22224.1 polyprotein 1a/1b [Blackcurrant-associated closterovirus 1]